MNCNKNNKSIHKKEDNEDNKDIKNLIDIIKKKNIKDLKVYKNSFTIKRRISNSILLEKYQKEKNNSDNKYIKIPFIFNNKIQHQNDFILEHQNKYHNIKKINYFPSNKIQINGEKTLQFIHPERKIKDNNFNSSSIITSNNSRYNNYNHFVSTNNKYINTSKIMNKNAQLKLKNDKKIKILYDLYCRRLDSYKNHHKMQRIKSAFSLSKNKHKIDFYPKKKDINIIKYDLNFNNPKITHNNINHNDIYNNKKNWLFKLIKLKKVVNIYKYDKHFGNTESCPLCQEMDKKNEESILKKGISPNKDNKKNESKTSLQHRRIYSAITNYRRKNRNGASKSDINDENENDANKSRNINMNKSGINTIKDKSINKKNKIKVINVFEKKLLLKKGNYKKDNFLNFTHNNF